MAGGVGPAQVEKMDSWYGMTIEAADGGPGITFSVIDFDSTSSAQDHLEKTISETPGVQVMDSPIGDASFEIEVNAQGIGSMLVFIKGDKLISLHTAQPEGEGPLLSLEGLKDLADLVASRVRELVPALNLSGISVAPPAPAPAVTGMIAPNLRLTFEGVEYTGVEVLSAASPPGPVVCCGTPINMDDMEVVGTGTNHNPDGDASVEVYRPKAGATTDVYTFHPAQTVEAS